MTKLFKLFLSKFLSEKFSILFFEIKEVLLKRKYVIIFLLFIVILTFVLDVCSAFIIQLLLVKQDNNSFLNKDLFFFNNLFENNNFYLNLIIVLFLQLIRELFVFLNVYLPGKIANKIEFESKSISMNNIFDMEKKTLDNENKNNLALQVHSFTLSLGHFFSDFVKIVSNLFVIFLYTTFIFLFQPYPSLVIVIILTIVVIITNRIILKQEKIAKDIISKDLRIHDLLIDSFKGILEIFSSNKEKFFISKTQNAMNAQFKFKLRSLWLTSLITPLQRSISIIALVIFIVIAGMLTNNDNIEPEIVSSAIIFIFLLFRLQAPLVEVNNLRATILKRIASVDKVKHIALKERILQNVKNDSFSSDFSFNDDINIKNLEFSYDKKKIIKKLNLKIFNKKITAVVGPTGSGKSTLINLLLKFYSPSSGIISVGKTDLQKISNNSWRKGISTIHQSPYIFNASILDNISMFDKSIDIKDIKRVSKNIGISEFINKLPKKYDSIIGGREIELSGGQKQKIQIARALVRKPKLLILDEATSSQDSISEDIIMKSIKRFFPNVTILIISHRFSSLKKAEYIYCINDGKLVEEGTWNSFNKKKSGLFKKMLNLQIIK